MLGDGESLIVAPSLSSREAGLDGVQTPASEERVRNIAHDLANLLMVISSYTELVLDSLSESDPRRKKVEEILKSSSRAVKLTRELLVVSRRQNAPGSAKNGRLVG